MARSKLTRLLEATDASTQRARQMLACLRLLHDALPAFAPADPADFPGLDHAFYDAVQADLEARGYRLLGDLENQTLTRAEPLRPAYIRLLTSADGRVQVALRHACLPAGRRVLTRLFHALGLAPKGPLERHGLSIATELSDGTFLSTSNAYEMDTGLDEVPSVHVYELLGTATLDELLATHAEQLRARLDAGLRAVPAHTLDDVLAAIHRFHAKVNAHRQAVGYLSEAWACRLFGPDQGPKIYAAMQRLLEQEQVVA